VWAKRKSPVTRALKQLNCDRLLTLELILAKVDKSSKGQGQGDPWDFLAECLIGLSGTDLGLNQAV